MFKGVSSFIRALVSDVALTQAYDARRASKPDEGSRTSVNLSVTLTLLFVVMTMFVIVGWVPLTITDYLSSREDLVTLSSEQVQIQRSPIIAEPCDATKICSPAAFQSSPLLSSSFEELATLEYNEPQTAQMLLQYSLSTSKWSKLKNHRSIVVSLPRMRFQRADIYFNGQRLKTLAEGERIHLTLENSEWVQTPLLKVGVVLLLGPAQRLIVGQQQGEPVLATTVGEYDRFVQYLGNKRGNAIGTIGMVAKVAIALFCLLLFLTVDASPESLGLALFMGFEAAAMGIGQGWIPLQQMPMGELLVTHKSAIVHYCYQMGDIMKLYFLVQIARLVHKGATGWLLLGTIVSIPYGLWREWGELNSVPNLYLSSLVRDSIVGGVGALACMRALWHIRGRKLPWRATAMIIAATAAAGEVVCSFIAHSAGQSSVPWLQNLFTIVQANIGYLFALATFVNISTLENRVRSLSKMQARMMEIEKELEIGRIVQNSLLTRPKFPDGVSVNCHQEPALFVSGDTYFLDWDKTSQVCTFILNDVAGHGIQAALKASATNILAKAIWSKTTDHQRFKGGDRLLDFAQRLRDVMVEDGKIPDFQSMIGAEFHEPSQELTILRSNFTFPVVIYPVSGTREADSDEGYYRVDHLLISNQQIHRRKLEPGTFVLFMSDGFTDSSRHLRRFVVYLREALRSQGPGVDQATVRKIVLGYGDFASAGPKDDRTLLVFHYESPTRASGRIDQTKAA